LSSLPVSKGMGGFLMSASAKLMRISLCFGSISACGLCLVSTGAPWTAPA
jgi:hypothetical protein